MIALIIGIFAILGGSWAIREYHMGIAFPLIIVASVCGGLICSDLFGMGAGIVLCVCMFIGGTGHMLFYED